MNMIDKALSVIAPEAALKRVAARKRLDMINSGYDNYGASHSKNAFRGWSHFGGSADEDIHDNLSTLRQRSRDLYCGAPIAVSAVKTMRTNVVGQGLTLKSQIDYEYLGISKEDARQTESAIEREFSMYADSVNCDSARLDNFYELQQLAFMNWLLSGDVAVLLPMKKRAGSIYELCIQLVEADRICTPDNMSYDENIHDGVETSDDGEVTAYYIARYHPFAIGCKDKLQEWRRVKAFGTITGRRNVLLLSNRERIGQIRGVPWLSPIIEALKQLSRYTEAELMAAVISGMFTVFIEKDGVTEEAPLGEIPSDSDGSDDLPAGSISLGNGTIIDLQEGEKAHDINPGRPNANFGGFVQAISEQIGAALELPYEVLMKHFTASYSASRGALLEAWKTFRMYRGWLVRDFCQPVYEQWLAEAVAKGRINAPGFFADPLIRRAYCSARWNGPSQGQLDPVKEVNAAVIKIENGLSTRATEARELTGSDFYANVRQLGDENRLLKEASADDKNKDNE